MLFSNQSLELLKPEVLELLTQVSDENNGTIKLRRISLAQIEQNMFMFRTFSLEL